MIEKNVVLIFLKLLWGEVGQVLLSINNDKPLGIDNLEVKVLRMVADSIDTTICHIFYLSLEESMCP